MSREATIAGLRKSVQLLELEEARVLRTLTAILDKKQHIYVQISLLAQKTTIDDLPTELLLQIFGFSLEEGYAAPSCDSPPLIISHVCCRWRTAALQCSSLWSRLVLNHRGIATHFVKRSGQQPLDVIYLSGLSMLHHGGLDLDIQRTSNRWRSLCWRSSERDLRLLLRLFNSDNFTFALLASLDLHLEEQRSPEIPIYLQSFRDTTFPALSHINLTRISPSELPSSCARSLRSLCVNFPVPHPYPQNLPPPLFRMSSFCAFLAQSTRLETLALDDCTPLMDVYLDKNCQTYIPLRSSTNVPVTAMLPMPAVPLPYLRCLDWTSAPPKDIWRLFHLLDVPNLEQVHLNLDISNRRWNTVYANNRVSTMDSDSPVSAHSINTIRFSNLSELEVTCLDVDGLRCALKRMEFPVLKSLRLSQAIEDEIRPSFPPLPTLDSIFHEPRLVNLTHFTISHFSLELHAIDMFAYMQSLEVLSIQSCRGVGKIVCALAGSSCGSPLDRPVGARWICPQLEHITLTNCPDAKFRCLKDTIQSRKHFSNSTAKDDQLCRRVIRPLRSIKKIHPQRNSSKAPHGQALPTTPLRAAMGLSAASPNGSFVPGWTPHERMKPKGITKVTVHGCKRISEVELLSLQDEQFGVLNVQWKAW